MKISIVIPVLNGKLTISDCLQAAINSEHNSSDYEIIVCDDGSTDNTVEIIESYPQVVLVKQDHGGASAARNAGAAVAKGELLFFIDADCMLQPDTISNAVDAMRGVDKLTVIGGTYTLSAPSENFFGQFQSAFIHHSEVKYIDSPDFVASHAQVMRNDTFQASGGFPVSFMPIIEDVEYSHRLRKTGHILKMDPTILVRHVFHFSLWRSIKNAFKKSRFWTRYSLSSNNLLTDSGPSSNEIKTATAVLGASLLLLTAWFMLDNQWLLLPIPFLWATNFAVSFNLLRSFHRAGGLSLLIPAMLYHFTVYPLPVGLGSLIGILEYPRKGVQ